MGRKKSNELAWLETVKCRYQLNEEQSQQLANLEKGFAGECYLDHLFEAVMSSDCFFMNDLNIKLHDSETQLDKIFLLGDSLYILDAKDYHGNYAYKGGQWYCNDKKLENNILYQLQRAKTILESLLKEVGLSDLKVRGVLIFTASDCRLIREGTLAEEIVMENQIASWLRNKSQLPFVTDEKVKRQLKSALEDKQQARVKTALAVEADTLGDMKQGICCESCRSFDLEKKHHMLVCRNCGHEESKEKAYVRTICEFGLIFHEEELTIGRVSHFFGRGWSRDSIKRMLKKHFNSTDKKGKASSYGNSGLDFEEWFEEEQEYFKKTEERLKWKQR